MNIDKQPQAFTPAYNPVLFNFSSTDARVLFFNIQVNDVLTGDRIINDKAYVSPITPTSTHYNLSDIAKDVVKWQIVNDGTLIQPITDSVRTLQLNMSDNGVIGNTMSQLSATASSNNFIVWNGSLPRHRFTDYQYTEWVAQTGRTIKFLTEKPNGSLTNNLARDFLYYLKEANFTGSIVKFEKFSCTGASLGSFTASYSGTASMARIDISPKAIALTQPSFFTSSVCSYTVQLFSGATAISEKKTFKWQAQPDCGHEVVNILWENTLGGIDSYQFIQPVETKNTERFTITRNPFQYDDAYQYTDIEQSTYNDKSRVIHTNITSEWRMWTRPLFDAENDWLSKIVFAKRWWIELKNGRTYPVELVETNLTVNRQKWNRGDRVQNQLTFKILDDVITEGQIYAGTASVALQTTTTTTTSSTTSTTTSGSSTTTTTSSTTTTTTASATTFTGVGYSSSTGLACSDADANNRTVYSPCPTISDGCMIYTDLSMTLPLLGFTHIYIPSLNWLINSSTGAITGVDPNQC